MNCRKQQGMPVCEMSHILEGAGSAGLRYEPCFDRYGGVAEPGQFSGMFRERDMGME